MTTRLQSRLDVWIKGDAVDEDAGEARVSISTKVPISTRDHIRELAKTIGVKRGDLVTEIFDHGLAYVEKIVAQKTRQEEKRQPPQPNAPEQRSSHNP